MKPRPGMSIELTPQPGDRERNVVTYTVRMEVPLCPPDFLTDAARERMLRNIIKCSTSEQA